MKKLIFILLLIFPLSLFSKDRVKGDWFDVRTHETIKYQKRHSIHHSKLFKPNETAKSIKRLQKKWKSLEYKY